VNRLTTTCRKVSLKDSPEAVIPTITVNTSYAPTSATPSNAELLLRIGDGDPTAWDEIVHRYGKLVSATVRSFRLQDADALDAAQTTWLRLAEHVHQIQHPDRLAGWLVTTARRECLQILRQTKFTLFDAVVETVTEPSADPEQHIIDADTARILWNFVSQLSPRQQAVLRTLFTHCPRPYAEAARITGIPPGGIGPTRARALAQLRDRLNQHGFEP
jgi:RNA polymerase sigma factor (sigma-70 family)